MPRTVDAEDSYCVLNPAGNLAVMQTRLECLVRQMRWEGVCGTVPRKEELLMTLQKRDMYINFGQVFFFN